MHEMLFICLLSLAASSAGEFAPSPNIVLIVADDLGWADLGCSGSDYYETPHIDSLARDGLTFVSAYANAANCAPTRAALLSGMYPPRTGVYTVSPSARGQTEHRRLIPIENTSQLDPNVVTLAEVLHSAGYATASFGKWHLGQGETGPRAQGFEVNVAGNGRGAPRSYFSPYRNPDIEDGPEGEHLTDRIGEDASRFIRTHAGSHDERPFFVYLPFYAVHTPIQPQSDWLAHYRNKPRGEQHTNAKYAALVSGMDEAVGRVLEAIESSGMADNTIIIFTSDNGGHGRITNNAPLRGAKGMFHEGGIRVPLIVRWPKSVPPGTRCDEPVMLLDLYPTLARIAAAELPVAQPLDGADLTPVLRDPSAALERDAIFWHFPCYLESGGVTNTRWRTTPCGAVRSGDWKLIEYFEDDTIELYNLRDDIGETTNLVAEHPEKAAVLLRTLRAWQADTQAPIPAKLNPDYATPRDGDFASVATEVDRVWIGPEYWANRLQDWRVRDGWIECIESRDNFPLRTLHLLPRSIRPTGGSVVISATIGNSDDVADDGPPRGCAGFLIGAGGSDVDHRLSAQVHHRPAEDGGLLAVVDRSGRVALYDNSSPGEGGNGGWSIRGALGPNDLREIEPARDDRPMRIAPNQGEIDLIVRISDSYGVQQLILIARNEQNQTLSSAQYDLVPGDIDGAIALVSHLGPAGGTRGFRFREWTILDNGQRVASHPDRAYGPVLCTQYTLHDDTLKLTAQFPPLGSDDSDTASLTLTRDGEILRTVTGTYEPDSATVPFRVDGWDSTHDADFTVHYTLQHGSHAVQTVYHGSIRAEPNDTPSVTVGSLNCAKIFTGGLKWNHNGIWFPHNETVAALRHHDPDILFFAGDQIYEGDLDPVDRRTEDIALLDYLYKWYRWCWAFHEVTRDRPTVTIPDDHDVYHGNVWGAGGVHAVPRDGLSAQDAGGYKMSPRFVNAVHRTQTSHLPDPYHNDLIGDGYSTYFTTMNYAGLSFAILADRQFKPSASVLVPNGRVRNGWFQNRDFDPRDADVKGAALLGAAQEEMLEAWAADWSDGVWMKVALSQSPFVNVATLPASATSDAVVPGLPLPEPGEYPANYALAADTDSNGWPQSGRNRAVKLLRRAFAVHLAGDQHLATLVEYGVDDWRDGGFAFTSPAISNTWPRRWFPPEPGANREPGAPRYTGDFEDGFGNRLTVYAVANPYRTGQEPANLYDRVPGYGIVRFERESREITFECWPRWTDPAVDANGQYSGWPRTVSQLQNHGEAIAGFLPEVRAERADTLIVQVIDEASNEIVYTIRPPGRSFKPPVYRGGPFTVRVREGDDGEWRERTGVRIQTVDSEDD